MLSIPGKGAICTGLLMPVKARPIGFGPSVAALSGQRRAADRIDRMPLREHAQAVARTLRTP